MGVCYFSKLADLTCVCKNLGEIIETKVVDNFAGFKTENESLPKRQLSIVNEVVVAFCDVEDCGHPPSSNSV